MKFKKKIPPSMQDMDYVFYYPPIALEKLSKLTKRKQFLNDDVFYKECEKIRNKYVKLIKKPKEVKES